MEMILYVFVNIADRSIVSLLLNNGKCVYPRIKKKTWRNKEA
jgi:hypothetical protein